MGCGAMHEADQQLPPPHAHPGRRWRASIDRNCGSSARGFDSGPLTLTLTLTLSLTLTLTLTRSSKE